MMKTLYYRMLLIAFGLLATLGANAQSLCLADIEMRQSDGLVSTTLDLQNGNVEYSGFQCDVYLPEGVSVSTDGNQDYAISINSAGRINDAEFSLGCVRQPDGAYRILCYSTSLKTISGTSGAVLDISLAVSDNIAVGEHKMEVKNIVLSRVNNNKVTPGNTTSTLLVKPDLYKLTYLLDGEMYYEAMVEEGTSLTPLAVPAKVGYTFSGWSEVPETMPSHDVIVTGSFTINMYKVTFISDGAVIKEDMLEYGAAITAPENPTKVGHTFTGWNPVVDATVPAHDVSYTAQFSANQYTITFDTDGGSTVAPITQSYGTAITKPADPVKEGYTFAGWNPAIPETMPAENMTIKALWTVNSYKLTYKVDGNVYKEYTLNYGAAITPEAEPTKEGYTFSGWSEIPQTMPAHDVVVTGSFTINKYIIKFVNEDGTVLQSSEVEYGVTPVYSGATPTKSATAEYTYVFAGWSPEIVAVTANATYTATYTRTTNQYKLVYKLDGNVYKEYTLNYGDAITPEAEPTKEGYTFSGWSEIPQTMPAHDVVVTGSFTKGAYKLTYFVDGAKYKEVSYDYGDAITPEAEPTREGYTFSGWSEIPQTMPAHDVVVNGSFTINKYTVKFVNEDGAVLQSSEIEYGVIPVYTGATPTKASNVQYSYTFTGWTPEIVAVTANTTYTATYTSSVNKYTVKFVNEDGTLLQSSEVEYGVIPVYTGATPTKASNVQYSYTFAGWTPEIVAVTANATYTATYTSSVNKYTVKFVNEDGTVLQSSEVEYGVTPVYIGTTPTKVATAEYSYTFAGWTPEIVAVTTDASYTATYTSTPNQYKLTYKIDGEVYKEYALNFGDAITPEAEPTKEGYTFSGWSEIPATMPAFDVEVNGSFEVNIYKASYFVGEELVHEDEVAFGETFELWTYDTEDEDLIFNGWIGEMYETMPAHDISYIADITSGIAYIISNQENVQGIYTLDGKKVENVHQGVYVIRMKDGSTRKFIAK